MQENVKLFYTIINTLDTEAYFENYMLYNLSPVIKGVKPAITLSINKSKALYDAWNQMNEQFLVSLGLKSVLLRETSTSIILYIYDEQQLSDVVCVQEVGEFLINLGYNLDNIQAIVDNLIHRYTLFNCPHELGIFLGIPIDDVKDFMICSDKPCVLCGYWQVYNNVDEAKKIFLAYDKAKDEMIYDLLANIKGA
ncbi:MAG: hypothetical protein ATN35_10565 [Epulopiscium sp. Nele67-Bin004]|nr:MAG: hypothetical protein ATN35_10565 [Epulopiscium sp. Nele67-Bin004]